MDQDDRQGQRTLGIGLSTEMTPLYQTDLSNPLGRQISTITTAV